MKKKVKVDVFRVLSAIEDKGYEAYVVGGYVRDQILIDYDSSDVDIATNAPQKELMKIFEKQNPKPFKYESVKFRMGKYRFEVTHYRKEEYVDGELKVTYTDDVQEDFQRRDFKVNSVYMNKKGRYFYTPLTKKNLEERILTFIGDPEKRLAEDPVRILRYIYIAVKCDLGFETNEIIKLKYLSYKYASLCTEEQFQKYLKLIDKLNNFKKFTLVIRDLHLQYFFFNHDMIADFTYEYAYYVMNDFKFVKFLPKEKQKIISNIKEILEVRTINNLTLYLYSLEENINAAVCMHMSKGSVMDIYNKMPIHSKKDVAINPKMIAELIHSPIDEKVKKIYNRIILLILKNRMPNKYDVIADFIIRSDKIDNR